MDSLGLPEGTSVDADRVREELLRTTGLVEITTCEPVADGLNVIYRVSGQDTSDQTRNFIVKICTFSDFGRFAAEPDLIELVRDQTTVPVPKVVVEQRNPDELHHQYYVMEEMAGENCREVLTAGDFQTKQSLVQSAGRQLGKLHTGTTAPVVGEIVRRDELTSTNAGDWDAAFNRISTRLAGQAASRFADLRERLHGEVNDASIPPTVEPSVLHLDYWSENLLVNDESVSGVIDWGRVVGGDALLGIAVAEYFLIESKQYSDGEKKQLRESFRRAHGAVRTGEEALEERWRLYQLYGVMRELRGFPYWYRNEESIAPREDAVRERAEQILGGSPITAPPRVETPE